MTTEDRLENWADVYRDRMRRQQAMSYEGNYRSKQSDHWQYGQAPPVSRPGIDWRDADIINGAWQSIPSGFSQVILGGWYIRKWSPGKCARVARVSMGDKERAPDPTEDQFQGILTVAHGLLERQLELPAVFRRERLAERVRLVLDLVEWRRMEAQPLDT